MSMKNRKRISQIVIDRKQDCGDLKNKFGEEWLHYYLYAVLFGLQPPAGIAMYQWIQAVCYCFAARAGLIASAVSLSVMMQWLVGVLNQNRETDAPVLVPDFSLMYEVATFANWDIWGAKGDYVKSLIQKLRAVSYECSFFRAFNGLDMVRDVISRGKSCVIEIPTVFPSWVRLFVVDLIILQILYSRIHSRSKTDDTEVIIYLDEGDQDLGTSSSDDVFLDKFSPQAQLFRYGREFGISCVVGLGVLGRVSEFISSSFQYTFMFNMSGGDQILHAKRALLLPPRAEEMLPGLKPGECIFRESQGAWAHPMWCKIDYIPPDRETREVEYDNHFFVPAKPLQELPHVLEALEKLITQHKATKKRQSRQTQSGPSNIALQLIELCYEEPLAPVVRLFEKMGKIRFSAQKQLREEMEKRQLAKFREMRLGSANVLIMQLLPGAYELLQKPPCSIEGQGTLEHRFPANWIKRAKEKQGHKAYIEWQVPNTNHRADVAVEVGEQYDLFEIVATCKSNLAESIKTCFTDPQLVRSVTIITTQKAIAKKLAAGITAEIPLFPHLDRVKFETIGPYLKELWP